MDSFISTTFKKQQQYADTLVNFYSTIRRYGCILTDHESITRLHVESVITILYEDVIYQITLVDGSITGLYDLTNRIEYKEM